MRYFLCEIIFLIVVATLVSCMPSSEIEYSKNGISLTIPAGWKIRETNEPNKCGFIICERNAIGSADQIIFSWCYDSLDVKQHLEEKIKENKRLFKILNPEFDSIHQCEVCDNSAYCVNYTQGVSGVNSKGFISCFYTKNMIFTVSLSEEIKPSKKSSEGRDKILSTFRIN